MRRATDRRVLRSEGRPEADASGAPTFLRRDPEELHRRSSGYDRRILVVVGVLLVLVVATGGVITVSLLATGSDAEVVAPDRGAAALPSMIFLPTTASPSALPSRSPTPLPSPSSTVEVVGSATVALDFDALATGANLGDWEISGDGALEVAALPTAVQRSARLDARTRSTACLPISTRMATLTTRFMVDRAPTSGYPLLAVAFEGGEAIELTLSDAGAALDGAADPVPLEAGAWYRWVLLNDADFLRVRLLAPDDEPLAEAELPIASKVVTEFCVATVAPTRAYLDEINVEAP